MFRIECFVDDRKLSSVLRSLAGNVIGQPGVMPVVNAEKKNGKVEATTNGNALDMFSDWLKKSKAIEVTPRQMQDFMTEHGYEASSYSNMLGRALKAKMVKRKRGTQGAASVYQVLA